MSRIGRLPIAIPKGVTVKVEGRTVHIEGPKGKDKHAVPAKIVVGVQDGTVSCSRSDDLNETRALHGLTRKLIANNGLKLNDAAVSDPKLVVDASALNSGGVLKLSSGKKKHVLVKPPGA